MADKPRLRECSIRAVRLDQPDEPVLRHFSAVRTAMTEAIGAILASTGFRAEDPHDEYRPNQLQVLGRATCRAETDMAATA